MSLPAGSKLGPYEIVAAAGAGGMGEVYRARDTRLEREVAIKVLPQHLSANPDLRARFEREARAISQLQHPHICTLHDVGHQDGTDFLVMEYLEGETLARRLERGALKTEDILRIGMEMADALEAAHRRGIVHRDLKPGNVMLTKAGAKLMDFGLAKGAAALGAGASPSGTAAPTFSAAATAASPASPMSPLTQAGTVVGTFQYMSPEQVEGKEADARSDIFSLGAVLYEMATGKRAFAGKSQLSVASAILEKDPEPITAIQPLAPPALEHVVKVCLAKEPEERFQSAHDVKVQLRWVAESGSRAGVPAVKLTRRKSRERLSWSLAAAGWMLAAVAVTLSAMWLREAERSQRVVQAELAADALAGVQVAPLALSPDGTRLALLSSSGGQRRLWVRTLATGQSQPLAGTEDAIFPFWSPDGQYLAFFADGKLKKAPAAGGPVQILADAPDGRGGSWSPAGAIIYTPNILEPLWRVGEGGGNAQQLTKLEDEGSERRDRSHRFPYFLPDGEHFLWVSRNIGEGVGRLYAGSLRGMEPKLVLERGSNVQYVDGYLLFLRDSNLMAQRFDLKKLELTGDAVALAENIAYWNPRDLGAFSAGREGTLVYQKSSVSESQFGWMDVGNPAIRTFGEPGRYAGVRVSPDGRKAVFNRVEPSGLADVWLLDLERLTMSRLTFQPAIGNMSAFSPDGSRVAIAQNGTAGRKIIVVSAVGAAQTETVMDATEWQFLWDWSPDGQYLITGIQHATRGMDVLYLPLEGKHEQAPLLQGNHQEGNARLSPNGKWLAYGSNESGRWETYITDFPAARRKIQVSSGGGSWPSWRADGHELFFWTDDSKFSAVEVRNPETMELGSVREAGSLPQEIVSADFLPGNKRLLVLRRAGEAKPQPVTLVMNWTRLLPR